MVRIKNRYLVVNILYPASVAPSEAGRALPELIQFHAPTSDALHGGALIFLIRKGIGELFGDYGHGVTTNLKVNYLSTATSTAIIRCPREHFQMVWAALTFITKLPKPIETPVVMRVARVSGTIRKAEEEVIRQAKAIIRRARDADGDRGDSILKGVVHTVERRRNAEDAVMVDVDGNEHSESDSDADGSDTHE